MLNRELAGGHLPKMNIHASQPRLKSPTVRNKSGKPSRKLRLAQVGQVPHSR
jgi:hypothetical protein